MKIKIFFILLALFYSNAILATIANPGFTGIIDFPTSYTLRPNNYNVAGTIDKINDDTIVGLMIETGFLTQLEAGLKITTDDTKINSNLLKANLKFQFLREGKNPAMAIGFVESDEGLSLEGKNTLRQSYGYLTLSKRLKHFVKKEIGSITVNGGLIYDESKNLNGFGGMEFPIYTNINLLFEFYSYTEFENNDEKTKLSVNIGGEFFTTEKTVTKVFWREKNDTFGILISYIGIYK